MQRFHDTAIRQRDACNSRVVEIDVFDVTAPRQIHSFLLVRAQGITVANINGTEQGIIAQVQGFQVAVAVFGVRISQLEALKPGRHGEVGIAYF